MNKFFTSCLLATMVAVLAVASTAAACGDYGAPDVEFEHAVTQQNRVIMINSEGSLISIAHLWGSVRNYGDFDRKLSPNIDVRGYLALVATETEVCEISLKTGKLIRTHKHSQGTCGVGFITAAKVFLNNGRSLAIMDMSNGATIRKIDLMKNTKSEEVLSILKPHIHHTRNGDLLYIARPCTFGIAVVDLNKGKRLKDLSIPNRAYTDRLHFSNGNLFLVNYNLSYGIINGETLNLIDVKTQTIKRSISIESQELSFSTTTKRHPLKMVPAKDGSIFVSANQKTWHIDNQGNIIK